MKGRIRYIVLAAATSMILFANCAYAKTVMPGPRIYTWELQKNNGTKLYHGSEVVTGWQKLDGEWYLISDEGYRLTGWQAKDGLWYYLSKEETKEHSIGACYMNEITPDGHQVNADGALVDGTTPVAGNPYGHDCVEVTIATQTVNVYYADGLYISSPCVTGRPTETRATTPGKYQIYAVQADRYLQGENEDGSKYKNWVSYWMPFNWGQGLHDASWRGSFGGNIYKTSGSHGCVNLPVNVAAQLFGIAYVGMPVYIN